MAMGPDNVSEFLQQDSRHIAILAAQPLRIVHELYARVTTELVEQQSGTNECLLSTRAVKNAETRYPVLTYTVPCLLEGEESPEEAQALWSSRGDAMEA
jgi:hypothetical protein